MPTGAGSTAREAREEELKRLKASLKAMGVGKKSKGKVQVAPYERGKPGTAKATKKKTSEESPEDTQMPEDDHIGYPAPV